MGTRATILRARASQASFRPSFSSLSLGFRYACERQLVSSVRLGCSRTYLLAEVPTSLEESVRRALVEVTSNFLVGLDDLGGQDGRGGGSELIC